MGCGAMNFSQIPFGAVFLLVGALAAGCQTETANGPPLVRPPAFPEYKQPAEPKDVEARPAPPAVLLQNGTVMTAAGKIFEHGHVLIQNGKIVDVGEGPGAGASSSTKVIDAAGKFITPGIIDTHSHM